MVNCDIYVLNKVKDCSPMSSTITVSDSDEEVIDLETSKDAIAESTASNDNDTIITVNLEDSIQTTEDGDNSLVAEEKAEVEEKRTNSEPRENEDDPKPLFKVMFRDESISRKYGEKVKEFFQKLVLVKPQQGCNNVCSELVLEIWGQDTCKEDSINSATESEDSSNIVCENNLFTMAKEPMLIDARNMPKTDIPTYEKKYHTTVNEAGIIEEEKPPKASCMPQKSCFNCDGNHNLKDCTKPRNQSNINKNRKEFNLKTNAKAVRYHLDDVQKFGRMIPGQLSKSLRRALGIKENELPRHIYRMRTLGYPPGWLEEARLQHSGLSLFNSEGRREIDPNELPGEIIVESDRDRYDIKKIYEFPGYNVPAPPGTHDDYKQYWLPYVEAAHSKDAMLLRLSGKKADDGYKRKKLKLSGPVTPNDSNCEPSEMDAVEIDESVVEIVPVTGHFVPPLPKNSPVKPPPPQSPQLSTHSPAQSPTQSYAESTAPPTPESPAPSSTQPPLPLLPPPPPQASTTVRGPSEDSDCQSQELQSPDSAYQTLQDGSTTTSSRVNSPSLFDLESMKKQILVELEDSSSQSNSDSVLKVAPSATSSKPDMPPPAATSTAELNDSVSMSMNNSVNNSLNDSLNNSVNNSVNISLNTSDAESSGLGTTKSVDFGTPILQSTSPYNKLPPSEKFSKNICDVINFENLPDSTGKYEQMTGVIQKVRSVLARIHKE